jgi:multidrug transporter EmrE-like cation transporter
MQGALVVDYQKYTDFLEGQVQFRYTIAIILAILFLAFAVLILSGFMKASKKENSMKSKLLFVLLCFLLFLISFYFLGKQIHEMQTDIKSNAYIVYEGEFTYEYVNHTRGGDVSEVSFIIDGKELTLAAEPLKIGSGTYIGKIVYAENSKYLLDYEVYESIEDSNK